MPLGRNFDMGIVIHGATRCRGGGRSGHDSGGVGYSRGLVHACYFIARNGCE